MRFSLSESARLCSSCLLFTLQQYSPSQCTSSPVAVTSRRNVEMETDVAVVQKCAGALHEQQRGGQRHPRRQLSAAAHLASAVQWHDVRLSLLLACVFRSKAKFELNFPQCQLGAAAHLPSAVCLCTLKHVITPATPWLRFQGQARASAPAWSSAAITHQLLTIHCALSQAAGHGPGEQGHPPLPGVGPAEAGPAEAHPGESPQHLPAAFGELQAV